MTDPRVHVQDLDLGLPPVPGEGESILPRAKGPDYLIEDRGFPTPCWVWQRGIDAQGYARISPCSPTPERRAHREYLKRAKGPIPEGWHTDHLCRNRYCVNPDHLEAVPAALNIQRGDQSKITMETARRVRDMIRDGSSYREITDETGVTTQNIWWIAEDRAWREDLNAPITPIRAIRYCPWCGDEITDGTRSKKFCNRAHRTKYAKAQRA